MNQLTDDIKNLLSIKKLVDEVPLSMKQHDAIVKLCDEYLEALLPERKK